MKRPIDTQGQDEAAPDDPFCRPRCGRRHVSWICDKDQRGGRELDARAQCSFADCGGDLRGRVG